MEMQLVQLQKSPLSYITLNTIGKSKYWGSSRTQGNILIVTPCKIKKQTTYLQHTVTQNLYYHSKEEEWGHNEKILKQIKTKIQHSTLQII